MIAGLTLEERIQFMTQGYLVRPNALERGIVDEANAILDAHEEQLIDGLGFDYNVGDDLGAGDFQLSGGRIKSLYNPISLDPLFLDLVLHPSYFPKVADVWDGNIRLLGSDYLATPPGAAPSLGWHNDVIRHDYPGIDAGSSIVRCHLMVMLSDVTDEDGPTILIPGSHRWPHGEQLPDEWIGRQDPESFTPHVKITGEAGTVWFFNTRLTHAQSPNRSDRWRRLVIFIMAQRFQRELSYLAWFSQEKLAELATTPIKAQLLGMTPPFDEPYAEYEVPARWQSLVSG